MNLKTFFLIICLVLIAAGLGYVRFVVLPYYQQQTAQQELVSALPSPTPSVEGETATTSAFPVEVDRVYDQLSPAQRAAQVMAVPVRVTAQTQINQFIASNSAGMVVLFGDNISSAAAEQALLTLSSAHPFHRNFPPLIGVDHEGGSVQRLRGSGFTRLPSWQAICRQPRQEQIQLLTQSATELKQVGIDVVFGPVVDVYPRTTSSATDSAKNILGDRICSDDASVVQGNSERWIQAFQQQGIVSVLKHYPGIGSAQSDLHKQFEAVPVTKDEQDIFFNILQKFPRVGVMTTFAGTADAPTVPCALNPACVQQLQSSPTQLIYTDGLEMMAAGYNENGTPKTLGERAVAAITAGNTVVVFSPGITTRQLEDVSQALQTAAEQSPEFQAQLEVAVKKVIYQKLLRGAE